MCSNTSPCSETAVDLSQRKPTRFRLSARREPQRAPGAVPGARMRAVSKTTQLCRREVLGKGKNSVKPCGG